MRNFGRRIVVDVISENELWYPILQTNLPGVVEFKHQKWWCLNGVISFVSEVCQAVVTLNILRDDVNRRLLFSGTVWVLLVPVLGTWNMNTNKFVTRFQQMDTIYLILKHSKNLNAVRQDDKFFFKSKIPSLDSTLEYIIACRCPRV